MKHTPGPWNIDPDEALIVSTTVDVQFIAMLGDRINDFGNAWSDPCMTDDVKANARLISAAPDMYEALGMMVSAVMGSGDATQALSYARAAIAKAEGNA